MSRAGALRLALAAWLALAPGCGPSAEGYPYLRGPGCEDGCDPDAGTDAGAAGDTGPPPIPDEPLEAWDVAGAGPLSGIFAVEVTTPARAVIDIEVRQIYRMRVLQRGADVRLRISPCRFSLPTIPGVATLSIPPRLEEVLRRIAVEDEGPFLSMADPVGATITTPTAWVVLGADLADPVADPLPTADMLETALDEDMDGQPGVTIAAEAVICRMPEEAYAALRTSVTMDGTVEDLDAIRGGVEVTLEQSILGISDRCLSAAATLDIEVLEGSTFTALRVGDARDLDANGNVSCPEIAWYAPELFGAFWSGP